jgi:hypothetical protein
MYRLNWLIVLGVIVLTGCEPADVHNFYDIDVVVEDNGNDGAEEPVDDDDSVVEDEETRLEIEYQGPGPGSMIEIGQCGTLIEVTYAAVGGDVTMNSHRFVQLIEDVWSNPFSSVTFLLNGIIHEDLVEFDPNPTGDHHVFNETFVISDGEELVATYSACIRPDMTLNAQSGTVQAVLDYRLFEAEDENGDAIEFDEEFQYGHRVVVSDPSQWDTCEFDLTVSETLNQTSCSGPLEMVIAIEDLQDGDVVQDPLESGDTLMHVMFDGARYTVPIGINFTSWYGEDACPSCAGVMEIESPMNASIPLGGNVTLKPGSKILTIASDTNMWVVDSCATARAVTPGVAQDIYGTDWADRLVIMPDVFFVDYLIGEPVDSALDYDLVAAEARTIEEELACLWGEDSVEEEPIEPPYATVTLNAFAPSGAAVPGFGDVIRFDVCAGTSSDIEIENMKFAISSTDNAGTGWNSCGNLGNTSLFTLYNVTNAYSVVTAGYSFTSEFNGGCNVVPNEMIGHANLLVSNEVIAAGTCMTYDLWIDTSSASSVYDDSIRVDISDEEWFIWSDSNGDGFDGSDLAGNLPITGGTLVF